MKKLFTDILFEHGELSFKRLGALVAFVLFSTDGCLLMVKSWMQEKEITSIDVTLFWAFAGLFGMLLGVAMINKMPQFRKSTNAPPEDIAR